jgi:alpha-D-ribose 1-methylphosphonate 5-triphosphate synthase subunit PhnH
MRTMLTIEDTLASELKKRALETGKPFKQVVNEILLPGLQTQSQHKPQSYRLKPASLGIPLSDVDLTKALWLADEIEDNAMRAKLEQHK